MKFRVFALLSKIPVTVAHLIKITGFYTITFRWYADMEQGGNYIFLVKESTCSVGFFVQLSLTLNLLSSIDGLQYTFNTGLNTPEHETNVTPTTQFQDITYFRFTINLHCLSRLLALFEIFQHWNQQCLSLQHPRTILPCSLKELLKCSSVNILENVHRNYCNTKKSLLLIYEVRPRSNFYPRNVYIYTLRR